MGILEQVKAGDFSTLSSWLDGQAGGENINATIDVDGKQYTLLHFIAAKALNADPQNERYLLELTAKALSKGADPHLGWNGGFEGDTAFNILAPSGNEVALEMGGMLTNHWYTKAESGLGSRTFHETSGSHGSPLAQYMAKWLKGDDLTERFQKLRDAGVDLAQQNGSGWTPLIAAMPMGNIDAVAALVKLYSDEELKYVTKELYKAPYGVSFSENLDAIKTGKARLKSNNDRDASPQLRENIEDCIFLVEAELYLRKNPKPKISLDRENVVAKQAKGKTQ